jgi:hypothetical protein
MQKLFAAAASASSDLSSFRDIISLDVEHYYARRHQAQLLHTDRSHSNEDRMTVLPHDVLGGLSQSMQCLKPASGSWNERHKPLLQELVPGRVCAHELCSADKCGIHVHDHVVLPSEAEDLVAHGQAVIDAEDLASRRPTRDLAYARSRRIDFIESAHHGSRPGHLLLLSVAERLRRILARTFGLPREQVQLAEHFLTLRQPGPTLEQPVHCDEAVFPHGESALARWRFHFSAVLWLSAPGADFDGGALAFYNNRSTPWLEVDPAVGRAAFFSSGWENIHGIKRVHKGRRWAMTSMFMVVSKQRSDVTSIRDTDSSGSSSSCSSSRDSDGASGSSSASGSTCNSTGRGTSGGPMERRHVGQTFYEQCVRPTSNPKHAYASCRQHWIESMRHEDPGTGMDAGDHQAQPQEQQQHSSSMKCEITGTGGRSRVT